MSNLYNLDLGTIQRLDIACCEIEIYDRDGKREEVDCHFLHEFLEANDTLLPITVLTMIDSLLRTREYRMNLGQFDWITIKQVGLIIKDSEEWEWDRRAYPVAA